MSDEIYMTPVGRVTNAFAAPVDDIWGGVESQIHLDGTQFAAEALAGLDQFSHVEIVYLFHGVAAEGVTKGARHPRGNKDWPSVGIFAQRAKNRPNRIGVTICRLVSVQGLSIVVGGLDAINNTPVLDIKPYMRQFGPRGKTHQPAWSGELMAGYWKDVVRLEEK